jgi:hypothetical protein
MGMYTAASDQDYEDENHGPYGSEVALTCADCKSPVWISRAEPLPPGPVLCDRCLYRQDIRRQQAIGVQVQKGNAA